ncbi:MAG: type II secretion system GspH family protein [Armatimonadota bacterium]|nr:type II secretion system GspH family protein [Armatimonadota bacterium]
MMKNFSQARRRQRGFTMLEVVIAFTLISLIFTGVISLFLSASRTTLKASAQISANQDGSVALQRVMQAVREAQSFALPNETTGVGGDFTVPANFAQSGFMTTLNGENIETAIEVSPPPSQTISLKNSSGATIAPTAFIRDGASPITFLIYRANPDGTTNPTSGTCLWEYSIQDAGATINQPLCRSIAAAAPNAVQFVRPVIGTPPVPQPFQVEVKIISSYYSLVNGTQTNEQTNGSVTSGLSGKCVLMRNHATTVLTGGTNQAASNNAFQFH